MDRFERLQKTLREFKRKAILHQLVKEAFKEAKLDKYVIRLNQKQLFDKGIDSDGDSLGVYSPYTITIKEKKRQKTDHITLKDTGEFYKSFTVTIKKDGIYFDADPIKIDDETGERSNLFDDFGKEILGLTEENKIKLIKKLKRPLKDAIRRKIIEAVRKS